MREFVREKWDKYFVIITNWLRGFEGISICNYRKLVERKVERI
jgi:hypothetical protein